MRGSTVVLVLDALSQDTRLKVFRILVAHSKDGITPTEIAGLMNDMPRNTLSAHLNTLNRAGLCSFKKQGKQVIYKPTCLTVKKVAEFLLKDCCGGGGLC